MYVSSYNDHTDELIKFLRNPDDDAPIREVEKAAGEIVKKAADDAAERVIDYLQDELTVRLEDQLRHVVSRTAEDLIKSALAGDAKTFGKLFQFEFQFKDTWYREGDRDLPLGVELRRKLFLMHRDLFENQMLTDMEAELAAIKRLRHLGAWRTMVEGDL
jgi:hypothetical protein